MRFSVVHGQTILIFSASLISGTGLQQTKPLEMSCSSGYMGDNSSARTPGIFLRGKEVFEDEHVEKSCTEKSFVDMKESAGLAAKESNPKKAVPKYKFLSQVIINFNNF